MLKSMHAEEDAKYTESRSLSFVRSLLRSPSFVQFVRSVRSWKGHFLTAPLTPSRFLTSVGKDRRSRRPGGDTGEAVVVYRVDIPRDQLGRQPGHLLGGQ